MKLRSLSVNSSHQNEVIIILMCKPVSSNLLCIKILSSSSAINPISVRIVRTIIVIIIIVCKLFKYHHSPSVTRSHQPYYLLKYYHPICKPLSSTLFHSTSDDHVRPICQNQFQFVLLVICM